MKPPSESKNPIQSDEKKQVSFVTGANGRLGRELIKVLLKKGDVVRALVKRKDFIVGLPTGVIPYVGDVSDGHVLNDACSGANNVFHLAAVVTQNKEKIDTIMRVNVEGTRNVLDACEHAHVNRLVFSSTLDIYGRSRKEPLNEDSVPKPTDSYGQSKLLAEQIISRYRISVPSTILRFATIYGKGFESSFFRIFKAIKAEKMRIIGNGQNHLALLHIYDAMQALMLSHTREEAIGRTFNITDGSSYTQEQLLHLAATLLHAPMPTKHVHEVFAHALAKAGKADADELRFMTSNRVIDITKAREELGYEPMVKMEEGGEELVKEFLNQTQTSF